VSRLVFEEMILAEKTTVHFAFALILVQICDLLARSPN